MLGQFRVFSDEEMEFIRNNPQISIPDLALKFQTSTEIVCRHFDDEIQSKRKKFISEKKHFPIYYDYLFRAFGANKKFVKDKDKTAVVVFIKQLIMFLARENGATLKQIANVLGYSEHSSIHYGINKIKDLLEYDKMTQIVYQEGKQRYKRLVEAAYLSRDYGLDTMKF